MRNRPPKQIEQEVENNEQEDAVVDVKDDGPSISSSKKNTLLIIVASLILIIFCYYIFFSGIEEEKPQIVEPVIQVPDELPKGPAEEIASKDEVGASIYDMAEIDKKEKSENIDLLEKQAKPEVPEIPELPKEISENKELLSMVDISKINVEKNTDKDIKSPETLIDPLNPNKITENISNEELKLRDKKIQELELKIKEQEEKNKLEIEKINDNYIKKEEEKIKAESQIKQKEIENDPVFDPRYSPIVVFSDRREGSPPVGVGQEKNIVMLKENEMDKIKKTDSTVQVSIIKDRSRTIAQGKMISAILETAIDTEYPGDVRGIVSRDVYGESGREILIPKGSRLFGSYSSSVQRGQGRVQISWNRLLRPDGLTLSLSLSAGDQYGRKGITGEVDNRFSSLVANSLLTSVLAVAGTFAAQSLMGNNSDAQTSTTINPVQGTTTTVGNAGNQALYDVTKVVIDIVGTLMKNSINMNPVIRIPQGTRMTVIVNSDIIIPKSKYQ